MMIKYMKTEDVQKLKFLDLDEGTVWTYNLEEDIKNLKEKIKDDKLIEIMTYDEFVETMCDNREKGGDFRVQIDQSWGRYLYKTDKGGLYYDHNRNQGILIVDCEDYDFPRT